MVHPTIPAFYIAGKELLIKTVAQAVPNYVMNCFELPRCLCDEMQRLMANFWWGDSLENKKIHWASWDKLCSPKNAGGLGFRHMHTFNLSLLAKQGWRLLQYPDSLVARLFKARYHPDTDFLQAERKSGMSYSWRSIMAGRELLKNGLRYQVGKGDKIRIWHDPWLLVPYSFKPFTPSMEGTEDWLVSDLIDGDDKSWCADLVCELFSEAEAETIIKIPLSLRGPEDRWMWHYNSKGVFSVRSCYYEARASPSLSRQHNASSSAGNGLSQYWTRIWRAHIPPKVRSFMWCLIRGFLPTRKNLSRKHVPLPSEACVFCDRALEDELHLFKDCKAIAEMWLISPLTLNSSNYQVPSMEEWFMVMMDRLPATQEEIWFILLWAVWNARNDVIWHDRPLDVWWTISWSLQWLNEYQRVQVENPKKAKRPRVKWKFPPTGRLKINVDGSYHITSGVGGIGVVVRSDRGNCIAALAKHITHATSALHMEALALRAGILMAVQEQWTDVEIKCDCAVLAAAFTRTNDDFSEIGCLVEDCKTYLESIDYVQVQHIDREANCVANRLAQIASSTDLDSIWFDETPAIIQDILYEDICHASSVTRNLGIMSPPWSHVSLI